MAKAISLPVPEVQYTVWPCMNCEHENKIKVPGFDQVTDKKKFVDARICCERCGEEHFVTVSPKKEVSRCRIK